MPMNHQHIVAQIKEHKLFGIIRGVDAEQLPRALETLYDAGIRLVEVTFDRTQGPANTRDCLAILQQQFADRLIYGAGTVTSVEDVETAAEYGCHFIVSPDCNPTVIRATRERGMVSLPAALTPTECLQAHAAGADFIKLFPGGLFGPGYVKAIAAPLSDLDFVVVGGVDQDNIPAFYQAGAVGFGVGSNLINNRLIEAGQFDQLHDNAAGFVAACNNLNA